MRITSSLRLTAATALSAVVATLAVAGPLAGTALANPRPKAPLPSVTATVSAADSTVLGTRTASPTAHFSWTVISGQAYTCFLDGASKSSCTTFADYSGIGSGTHTFTIKVAKYSTFRPNSYVYTWQVDRTPPSSPPSVDPQPSPTSSVTANITFGKVDPSTASFKCALDNSDPTAATACSSPWPLSNLSEQSHTAYVYAVDDLLNMNTTPGTVTWVVDHTAPNSPTVSVLPVGPTNSSDASITWVDTDAVSFSCVLDNNAAVKPCTTPWALHNLTEGTHVVAVTGTDGAGNVGTAGKVHWIVDQTPPPAPSISTGPAATTDNTMATFQFGDADAGATFECKLDVNGVTGSFASCTTPTTYLGPLSDGNYAFSVRATDAAGNQGQASTWAWTIDTANPPAASAPQILSGPATLTHDANPAFTFVSLDDPSATFLCAVDPASPSNQAAYSSCSSGDSFHVAVDGGHALYVEEVSAGANSLPSTWNWTLDSSPPPAPAFNAKPDAFSNDTAALFNFSDTEANVSYVCQLDAQTAFACATPASVTQLGEGSHTFTVSATDAAGNTSPDSVATYSWTVDLTAPAKPTVNGADPSGTTATLSFSNDTDNDVTGYLCTLDTSAVASCDASPSFSDLSAGSHTILVQAVDHAGNVSLPQPFTWSVDPGVPNAPAFSHNPATLTNATTADFTFSDDATAGDANTVVSDFACWIDGVKQPDCSTTDFTGVPGGTAHLTALSEGEHTFTVEGINSLGNSTPASYVWTVDTTSPNISVSGLPAAGSLVNSTSIAPTVSDDDANTSNSYTCSLTGPNSFTSTDCAGASNLPDGSYTFTADTTDLAGNAATQFTRHWTVDGTAPTATLAVPSTLTGSAVATWSETVSGLDLSKVTLKETRSGKVVPATFHCLSAGAAASCGSSLNTLRVTPKSRLVPGQHYTISVAGGAAKDAASNATVPAARNFRAQRTLQETTLPVAVSWRTVKARTAFGHSYLSEHLAGAQATWAFRGKAITWWTVTGPTEGKANVYVDGHRKATVNNYKPETSYRVARTFRRLGAGRHVLTIRVLGLKGHKGATGTSVAVDAFTLGRTRTATPRVGASWHLLTGSAFYGRHAVVADLAGESISLRFRGTSIAWTTVRNRTQGKAAVYVDGVRKAIVDNYSARSLSKVRRLVRGLTDSVHTLRVVVLGKHHKGAKGNQVTVDRFVIG